MKANDKSGVKEYLATENRYENMTYKRSGKSGVLLPAISIGLWHNFGFIDPIQNGREILRTAFDLGITHFDLANNYGPPYGSAEENFGTIFKKDFKSYRDELFIATKAGYDMWPGPYGDFGSRKYLISSLDQSLKRMGLDYVDIFYHHRPDPDTPLEETMGALADIVRQGKALYVGISNYNPEDTQKAAELLKDSKVPFILHQARYSMFDRWVEDSLLDTLENNGVGCIAFSPLAQGMLTDKYLNGVPEGSRAAKELTYLNKESVTDNLDKIRKLDAIAKERGQKLSQMAIAWILRQPQVASVLVGASSSNQLKENVKGLDLLKFSDEELKLIESIIA
ncbi:L-glyceraldehyde 3-phosphate reductase [Algibacter amylolyticus]|uniref:L-glyceraldehyde 3-phosphate reductase n=1 Tax=Algibacter amylolyticus TaxID=1608400 RepID=A0A5M7AXR0_9FLAO|nr:L-glyceraldehyde 3-phosphate reductase [Algibacter amylolyticus]KAA5821440.1 L-glyceraldehyde 3-phosphate reductase [Algibacter amylolyticus]MBB5268315.1 L-glyceraldehyde 3-phosphate reductase [Algibacter amylolyticus]TSJ72952.1 L-glyceraldehyde 3-phosphate reductase [Algibacter amylolyticus]